jgi:phosphonate transport system permease protein
MSIQTAVNPIHKPAPTQTDREMYLKPFRPISLRMIILVLVIAGMYGIGLQNTEASPQELIEGIPNIVNFIVRCFPPAFELTTWRSPFGVIEYPVVLLSIIQTMFIALVGTSAAIILAIPLGILAARNVTPSTSIYFAVRFVMNTVRSVPELFLALVFVAAVGLGPFAGVLALMTHSIGSLGRVYGDSIESIDPQQVMAVRATGAGALSVFRFAVLPQAMPHITSYALLIFEGNIRAATVLGYVGGGGVGFHIQKYFALFQYQNLMGALVLIISTVLLIDRLSAYIRKKIV